MNRSREFINFIESVSRYCFKYKATDGSWYMDLASREYGERSDATTYGPFNSEEELNNYLSSSFSNPGGAEVDDSGSEPVPTKSPDGSDIVSPRGSRRGYL